MSGGTFALSWGRSGGIYAMRRRGWCWRVCLGPLAVTYFADDLDDLLRLSEAPER